MNAHMRHLASLALIFGAWFALIGFALELIGIPVVIIVVGYLIIPLAIATIHFSITHKEA